MAGIGQDKLKKEGRNMARADNQKSSAQPPLNLNHGASDGGTIGRGKSPRKNGVYRGVKD